MRKFLKRLLLAMQLCKDYETTYTKGTLITTKCMCGKVLKKEFVEDE